MADEVPATEARPGTAASYWHSQLKLAEREEREWRDESEAIVCRYKDERRRGAVRLNILASTMELLQPSVFARAPKPSVRRRRLGEDPALSAIGRQAAMALEKTLAYLQDTGDFEPAMHRVSLDMLLCGRGVARIDYTAEIIRREDFQVLQGPLDPTIGERPPVYLLDGMPVEPEIDLETGQPYVEIKVSERVDVRHVFWSDYRQEPARCWQDVGWVAFRHVMRRRQLVAEFGEVGHEVPLSVGGTRGDVIYETSADPGSPTDPPSRSSKAAIWEIWSKYDRMRLWVAEGFDHVLREDGDPLGLEGFFPCAEPVRHIAPTDSLVPVPEFRWWKDQADELDCIQSRIRHLVEVVKAVLITDGDLSEVVKVADARDGTAIPMERPGEAAGDLANAIFMWPFQHCVAAINTLSQRAEVLKQQIFEVSGVSDIMRGSVAERESAAASKMKVSFGRVRSTPRSAPMARFVESTLKLMGEVVAEHFEPDTLARVSGVPVSPEAVQLLREEKLRDVVLEISDEDMVAEDREREKAEGVELIQALSGFLKEAITLTQAAPVMAPLMFQTLKVALRGFRASREVEELIDQTAGAIVQQAQQQQAMAQQQMAMQQQIAAAQQAQAAPTARMVQ